MVANQYQMLHILFFSLTYRAVLFLILLLLYRKGKAGRGCIPNRVDIDKRSKIVEKKYRLGDWELDTIIGKNHQGAIVSMVERVSKATDSQIEEIENLLNNRPRKVLQFRTPIEVFNELSQRPEVFALQS